MVSARTPCSISAVTARLVEPVTTVESSLEYDHATPTGCAMALFSRYSRIRRTCSTREGSPSRPSARRERAV
jgi:hypothetical protein